MTLLVTGAAGLVGTHLIHRLRARDPAARLLAAGRDPARAPPGSVAVALDVRDEAALRELVARERPATIFHLAAQSAVAPSWADPWTTLEINIRGTVNLFEAVKALRRDVPAYDPVVVVASSAAAYGASLPEDGTPVGEEAALRPLHPYGVSKAAQDMLADQYGRNDGIRAIRARIFSSTGPGKRGDAVSDFARRVAALRRSGARAGVLRTGRLSTRRAILDVRDLVDALLALAERGEAGAAYNICAEEAVAIGDLVPLFEAASGLALTTEPDPALMRPSDEAVILGDTTRLRARTGWQPRIGLAETVRDTLEHEKRLLDGAAGPPSGEAG